MNGVSEERYVRWLVKTGKGSTRLATRKTTRFDIISCQRLDKILILSLILILIVRSEKLVVTGWIWFWGALLLHWGNLRWGGSKWFLRLLNSNLTHQYETYEHTSSRMPFVTLCFTSCFRWKQLDWLQKLILSLGLVLEHSPSQVRWNRPTIKLLIIFEI